MIGTIIIAMVLGVAIGFLLRRQCTRIRAHGAPLPWARLSLGALAGGGLGILVNLWEFQVGGRLRVVGFPIPGVFFHLEDGQWVDFVVPCPWMNMIMSICLVSLCGVAAVALISGRGKTSQNQRSQATV